MDALHILAAINGRENVARRALTPIDKTTNDPDGVWDCDNYARSKYMAPDWPQGIPSEQMDVSLPDGRLHRVVVATVGSQRYVLDNLTNALLTQQDRESGGWKFAPTSEGRVQEPTGLLGLGRQVLASR